MKLLSVFFVWLSLDSLAFSKDIKWQIDDVAMGCSGKLEVPVSFV